MGQPVVHFEVGCKDKEATSAFYAAAFGWTIDAGPMGAIETGSSEGIQGHVAALGHDPHQFTHFYVQVDDVAEALIEGRVARRQDRSAPGADPNGDVCLVRRCRGQYGGAVEACVGQGR